MSWHHGAVKNLPVLLLSVLLLSSCATLAQLPASLARPPDESPHWDAVARGVDYSVFVSTGPRVDARALRVNLSAEGLVPVVTPGSGGMTKSQFVSSFARLYGCAAAVNTAPFRPASAVEGEPREVVGLTIAGGVVVSPPVAPMAVLLLRRAEDGGLRAQIVLQTPGLERSREGGPIVAAAGGFTIVLSEGKPMADNRRREPRTAAGVSADGRTLYLLVADGRRPGSAGLTDYETGLWLARLGADRGMTLDGGGSSAMALRGADGIVRIVNVPIHGGTPGRERAVGSCLGFQAASLP